MWWYFQSKNFPCRYLGYVYTNLVANTQLCRGPNRHITKHISPQRPILLAVPAKTDFAADLLSDSNAGLTPYWLPSLSTSLIRKMLLDCDASSRLTFFNSGMFLYEAGASVVASAAGAAGASSSLASSALASASFLAAWLPLMPSTTLRPSACIVMLSSSLLR